MWACKNIPFRNISKMTFKMSDHHNNWFSYSPYLWCSKCCWTKSLFQAKLFSSTYHKSFPLWFSNDAACLKCPVITISCVPPHSYTITFLLFRPQSRWLSIILSTVINLPLILSIYFIQRSVIYQIKHEASVGLLFFLWIPGRITVTILSWICTCSPR